MAALRECRRVLKSGGHLFYTVPMVVGRLTKSRAGLPPSYHGAPATAADDYRVQTEYGSDFWRELFEAGFDNLCLTSLLFPASVAVQADEIKFAHQDRVLSAASRRPTSSAFARLLKAEMRK